MTPPPPLPERGLPLRQPPAEHPYQTSYLTEPASGGLLAFYGALPRVRTVERPEESDLVVVMRRVGAPDGKCRWDEFRHSGADNFC